MPKSKSVGNGLGKNKAPTWKPNSFGPGTFKGPGMQKVPSHKRPLKSGTP